MTAVSRAQSKVTLNELLDTLRLLEEEPELLPPPKLFKKDRYAWIDGVSRGLRPVVSNLRQRRLPGEGRFPYGLLSPSTCWVVEGEKRSWFTAREGSGGVWRQRRGLETARAWVSARRSKTVRGLWWEWG